MSVRQPGLTKIALRKAGASSGDSALEVSADPRADPGLSLPLFSVARFGSFSFEKVGSSATDWYRYPELVGSTTLIAPGQEILVSGLNSDVERAYICRMTGVSACSTYAAFKINGTAIYNPVAHIINGVCTIHEWIAQWADTGLDLDFTLRIFKGAAFWHLWVEGLSSASDFSNLLFTQSASSFSSATAITSFSFIVNDSPGLAAFSKLSIYTDRDAQFV